MIMLAYGIYVSRLCGPVTESCQEYKFLVVFLFKCFIWSLFLIFGFCSGSLFTNSNWFAFEDDRVANERSAGALASSSPNNEGSGVVNTWGSDEVIVGKDDNLDDTATSSPVPKPNLDDPSMSNLSKDCKEAGISAGDKPTAWVEWRETPDSNDPSHAVVPRVPNGEILVDSEAQGGDGDPGATESVPRDALVNNDNAVAGGSLNAISESPSPNPSSLSESDNKNPSLDITASDNVRMAEGTEEIPKATKDDPKDVDKEAEN